MNFKIHLIDLHNNISQIIDKLKWKDIFVHENTDISSIKIEPYSVFVSPGNSLGFMDGGVDYVLSRKMFNGIESKVKQSIKHMGYKTLLRRYYLPIGKSIVTETQFNNVWLIAAPTMWLPQNVSNTHNAYNAMYAIMDLLENSKLQIHNVYMTCLCTGYGKMDIETSIIQMKDAYDDYKQNIPRRYSDEYIINEQPNYYMNLEFKNIKPEDIIQII